MQTDLRLEAKVEGQDGHSLGDIKHLVMSPDKNQVTDIIVGGEPYTDYLRLVEVSKVGQVSQDNGTVRLSLSKEQFKQLPEFNEHKFAQERGYPANLQQAFNGEHAPGQGSESFAVGGYGLDPTANLTPPGIVDNKATNS